MPSLRLLTLGSQLPCHEATLWKGPSNKELREAFSQQPVKSGSPQSNKEQRSRSLSLEGDHPQVEFSGETTAPVRNLTATSRET